MTRRQLHNAIAFGITIPAIALGWYFVLIQRQAGPFLITCGVYVMALLLVSVLLRAHVPPHKRQRPEPPPEITRLRLGLAGEKLTRILASMSLHEQRTARPNILSRRRQYELYNASKAFANGTWTWWIETSGGEVVAYAASYQSDEFPALDKGWTEATGSTAFLNTPGS